MTYMHVFAISVEIINRFASDIHQIVGKFVFYAYNWFKTRLPNKKIQVNLTYMFVLAISFEPINWFTPDFY